MTTYNNTTQRREPTCDKCNTPMHTRRVHRFSGCITLIGYVLTLPFFLAVLIGLMGIVVGAVSTADKACEVATTAVAISLMLGVEFIIPLCHRPLSRAYATHLALPKLRPLLRAL